MSDRIERFEDVEVWKLALECANLIYDMTSTGEFSRDFALRDQIRRSAISVFSNIAEGFERDGNIELCNFLTIAKGSCGEARAQAIFAHNRGYIPDSDFEQLLAKLLQTNRQLSGFRSYVRRSDIKGRKFN